MKAKCPVEHGLDFDLIHDLAATCPLRERYTVTEVEDWLTHQPWKLMAVGDVRHKRHGLAAYFKAKEPSHE